LQRHVGVEHSVEEGKELAFGHQVMVYLVAGEEEQQRNSERTDEVHQRSGADRSADPAHVFAEEPARRFAKSVNLKIFHAESLDHTVSAHGLLENLAQITEASLTVFRGTPDFAAEFIHRPNDQRQQKGATQGHLPIDAEQNGDKY